MPLDPDEIRTPPLPEPEPDELAPAPALDEPASTNPSAQGVPGALSNQPPVPPTAPLTQPAVAGAGPAAPGQPPVPGQINAAGVQAVIAGVGQPLSTSKNATRKFMLCTYPT